jgi:predicted enzyme related to lactoylglutathione lyase
MEVRMPVNYQIDYLEFPSSDGLKSRRFFSEAFGWTFTDYGATYAGIEAAGIGAGIDSDTTRPSAPLAVIRTADLEEAQQHVEAAGGVITRPAYDFPGGRRFHFREPGGNELAVYIEVP